ncbi:MAG TPA: hypothetical protein VFV02_09525, partial [Acidimicrobiales bacterium]|nr:hypothetical protein [Acidimicrobiales bacterium]
FRQSFWAGLEDGSITVAYRRWKKPTVRAGGTLNSPGGLLAIDSVDPADEASISEADALAAGYSGRGELVADLRPEGTLFRIGFRRIGEDPRVALRDSTDLTPEDEARISSLFARNGWALPYLRLIAELPETVSTELAARVGVDRLVFKQRVRRLKALGLTESLDVGYRLSPRGSAVLESRSRQA